MFRLHPLAADPLESLHRHSYSRVDDADGDGEYDDDFSFINQPVTLNNQISTRVNNVDETTFVHDLRGNLIWDGDYVYRYDAFSRLVGVYERGTAQLDAATGRITNTSVLGSRKAAFAYDAVGRLITYDNGSAVEHYYYDGVRRIQTVCREAGPADPRPARN